MIQKIKSFFTVLNKIYTSIISSKILFLFTIILIFFFGKYFNDIQEYLTFQAYLFREALFFTYDYFFSSPLPPNISETENIIKSESNYPSKKKILIICGITIGIICTGVAAYCFIPAVAPLVNATSAAAFELATTTATDFSSLPGVLGSILASCFSSGPSGNFSNENLPSTGPTVTFYNTNNTNNINNINTTISPLNYELPDLVEEEVTRVPTPPASAEPISTQTQPQPPLTEPTHSTTSNYFNSSNSFEEEEDEEGEILDEPYRSIFRSFLIKYSQQSSQNDEDPSA